LSPLNTTKS
jgi:hypothetical protein